MSSCTPDNQRLLNFVLRGAGIVGGILSTLTGVFLLVFREDGGGNNNETGTTTAAAATGTGTETRGGGMGPVGRSTNTLQLVMMLVYIVSLAGLLPILFEFAFALPNFLQPIFGIFKSRGLRGGYQIAVAGPMNLMYASGLGYFFASVVILTGIVNSIVAYMGSIESDESLASITMGNMVGGSIGRAVGSAPAQAAAVFNRDSSQPSGGFMGASPPMSMGGGRPGSGAGAPRSFNGGGPGGGGNNTPYNNGPGPNSYNNAGPMSMGGPNPFGGGGPPQSMNNGRASYNPGPIVAAQPAFPPKGERCTVMFDFTPESPNELQVSAGQVFVVTEKMAEWMQGYIEGGNGAEGMVPSSYLEPIQ